MTGRYVAAIDQGTTSSRCLVFDRRGRMVAVSRSVHQQYFPGPGRVEHDAAEIWGAVRQLLPRTLADAGIGPDDLAALGITNQRETIVAWNRRTGVPVMPALVWQDTRAQDLLPEIAADLPLPSDGRTLAARTGLPLSAYSSGPKLRWMFDSDPTLAAEARAGDVLVGTVDSWLVWNLTGGPVGGLHVTDPTNASRTLLMDLTTLDWDDDLLAAMRVPRTALPRIVPTMGSFGTTVDPVPGIAIRAAIGDQQASLFGHTALESGDAKCTFGTGGFMLLNTGTEPVRSRNGLVTTVAHTAEGESPVYALEGSIAVTGGLVEWCRDGLGIIRSAPEIETLAREVDDNGGCYVVPAFAGLYSPHWEGAARGLVAGLTQFVGRAHIARAVLEATAWATRDVADAMAADRGQPLRLLLVDGGMTANTLLMQLVSDALDVRVVRPMMGESVALGAAYAAGLSAGYWPDRSVLRRNWLRAGEWRPATDPARRDAELARWRRAVELAIEWGRPVGADAGPPTFPPPPGQRCGYRE